MKDELFKEPNDSIAGFEFDERVAAVFDDMLYRSVPFYSEAQAMIIDFVKHFYQEGSTVYDLGCSTGTMIAALAQKLPGIDTIIGVDNAAPMIEKARGRLKSLELAPHIELKTGDLRETEIANAAAVIMSYTLQFIRPLYREKVVRRIFEGLNPGGIFILSEKVLEDSTHLSRLFAEMYYQFKRRQGYSELEISRKREKLENVLIPYTVSEQRTLLKAVGFDQVEIFFKWHNFASFLAVKPL